MFIKYAPVAGLTIEEAIIRAAQMAKEENKPVMAIINDIVMCFDNKTIVVRALEEYYQKSYIKHYVENMKRIK